MRNGRFSKHFVQGCDGTACQATLAHGLAGRMVPLTWNFHHFMSEI
jgi:hypothetical protein